MGIRDAPGPDAGHGDGTFTKDGCPVEMYAAMPPDLESAHVVHATVPARSSVLELGCGTGRISEPLADLGHIVTGVDSSERMLDKLVRTRPILSEIESLDLPEVFDVVLLASTLINTADDDERVHFLLAARRHLQKGGHLVLERRDPAWHPVEGKESRLGPVRVHLRDVAWHDRMTLSATVVHRLEDMVAMQEFSARLLDDADLDARLTATGFEPATRISDDGRWLRAEAASSWHRA